MNDLPIAFILFEWIPAWDRSEWDRFITGALALFTAIVSFMLWYVMFRNRTGIPLDRALTLRELAFTILFARLWISFWFDAYETWQAGVNYAFILVCITYVFVTLIREYRIIPPSLTRKEARGLEHRRPIDLRKSNIKRIRQEKMSRGTTN